MVGEKPVVPLFACPLVVLAPALDVVHLQPVELHAGDRVADVVELAAGKDVFGQQRDGRGFRRKRPEFALLTKYIFPGGELDNIGNTVAGMELNGFEVHDVEGWREHYQRTCKQWHDRLLANHDAAVREVGSVKTRMWLVYLAACSI